MEDEAFTVKAGKVRGGWERPRWVKTEDALKAEELAERCDTTIY